jgi:cytochrome c2
MKLTSFFALLMLPVSAQLNASFQSGDKNDHRIDRLPAIVLNTGEAPTAFLKPGPFQVSWTGKLTLASRQRLIFSFEGDGEATLSIDGTELLTEKGKLGTARSEQTRLNSGEHDVVIRYTSPPDGSARFRLFWEERSFPRQSVPPTAFISKPDEATTATLVKRRGRELFALHHCSKCHLSETSLGPDPMQEMLEIAPLLINPGNRLNESWLRAWLSDPHALRPGTKMPQLFDPDKKESAQQIADLAAFLGSMKTTAITPAPVAPAEAVVLAGGAHFHRLGCVACHTTPDQQKADIERKRIPLNNVAAKFQPGQLTEYLKDPSAYAPHRGMPNFKLNEEECASLSAFLIAKSKPSIPAAADLKGDAQRGMEVAKTHHCFSCHAGLPVAEKVTTPTLRKIFAVDWSTRGCVADDAQRGIAPQLHLSAEDKAALIAFAASGTDSLAHNDKAEAAERKFHSLRCDACHARDAIPALLDSTHGETTSLTSHIVGANEIIDQTRPHMTFIGEMLQTTYMESVIGGTLPQKARPWLQMRMPAYANHAKSLSDGFARIHGIDPAEKNVVTTDAAMIAIGADLVSTDKGFGCTTCHGLKNTPPTAVFEVQGLNFELTAPRLRREWFDRWIDNPASVTPGTKMPQYAPGGQSPNAALNGKAADQFHAIWQYLHSFEK